jgi:LDH2 family malate/lactate/ureidoglycolate dehydrogenase
LIDFVRSSPRKAGVDAIRLPGDRANACRAMRRVEGIPLDDGTWKSLASLAESLGAQAPATSAIPAKGR